MLKTGGQPRDFNAFLGVWAALGWNWFYLVTGFSKPSFPALVVYDSFVKVFFSEIGPAHLGKVEFGIGQLIEQEIADPVLSAGANHQFGVRESAGCQVFLEGVLVDLLNFEVIFFHLPGDAFHGIE